MSSDLEDAASDFEDLGFDTEVSFRGSEDFHTEIGEYWLPPHIVVRGDIEGRLSDLSQTMDTHRLRVHREGAVGMYDLDDGWVRLVEAPDWLLDTSLEVQKELSGET